MSVWVESCFKIQAYKIYILENTTTFPMMCFLSYYILEALVAKCSTVRRFHTEPLLDASQPSFSDQQWEISPAEIQRSSSCAVPPHRSLQITVGSAGSYSTYRYRIVFIASYCTQPHYDNISSVFLECAQFYKPAQNLKLSEFKLFPQQHF